MNRNRKILVFSILFVTSVVIYLFTTYLPNQKLEKDYRYTVAMVTGYNMPVDGSEQALFSYFVDSKKYTGWLPRFSDHDKIYEVGDRIYLKYYPAEPDIIEIISDRKVLDSIKFIPINGWDKLP